MAKIKLQGHASGTGVVTVTAPNTSTDRTITLPDATGSLLTSADIVETNLTATSNIGLGANAVDSITTGDYNVGVGDSALTANTEGSYNVGSGSFSLYSNTTGVGNVASGYYSLHLNSTGNYNTANGYYAGYANTTGANNTALGYVAGDNITTGSSNIIIGSGIDAPSATASNQINIGNYIHNEVGASNEYGNLDVTMGSTSLNVLAVSQNTAVALFTGGSTTFSGMVVINDINNSGEAAIFICGGGQFKLISQTGVSFVNNSSPNTSQNGYYLSSNRMYLKPGRSGTTNFRIISLRTRNSQ